MRPGSQRDVDAMCKAQQFREDTMMQSLIIVCLALRRRVVVIGRCYKGSPLYTAEGLAVGVGFGAIGKTPSATLESARSVNMGTLQ